MVALSEGGGVGYNAPVMSDTPLRRQYLDIKRRYPDAILLFRLGDFYETFEDDARAASAALGITLTSRELGKGKRYPMAGIPHHALDNYLGRLIDAGHKVAICEQTSEPGDGLVERDVVRVVTPGTLVEENLLDGKSNNFLAAALVEGYSAGLAHLDVSTGEFAAAQLPADGLDLEIGRLAPAELLVRAGDQVPAPPPVRPTESPDRDFEFDDAEDRLKRRFGVLTLEAFGCADKPLAVAAAGAVLAYLERTQPSAAASVTSLATYSTERYMALDPQTRRNLEIAQAGRWGGEGQSLLSAIDETRTPMGARMLRRWMGQPLLDREPLDARLDAVAWFHERPLARERAADLLKFMPDLERLSGRVAAGRAAPRDLAALRRGLEAVPDLAALLAPSGGAEGERGGGIDGLLARLDPCADVADAIAEAVVDDPPAVLSDGGVLRSGLDEELDRLRGVSTGARTHLAALESKERERTGVKSLKVGYNRVFGYYIEIGRSNQAKVPDDYVRRQTLAGAERYVTPELKEYESTILNAQERIQDLETALFKRLCERIAACCDGVLATAAALGEADVYAGFAAAAARYGYVRPTLTDGDELEIVNGRHPVVERVIPQGGFVPNDTKMSRGGARVVVLTGPNMSGKSTYLRQVGLIVLLAQIGCFVPADAARIGIVDRIFTRVGLQDDLTAGQSTFMVEMVETAQILRNATERSLIILDEIGRGTSTYDGLSIARAVAEYIHNHPELGAKTLFATHYHELTDLAGMLPGVKNFHVAVAEKDGEVAFLHKIVPGAADKSYGVHVATLAGMPPAVVSRAREVLQGLERENGRRPRRRRSAPANPEQPTLLPPASETSERLLDIDVASLTPLEAITKLFELQDTARRESEGGRGKERGG